MIEYTQKVGGNEIIIGLSDKKKSFAIKYWFGWVVIFGLITVNQIYLHSKLASIIIFIFALGRFAFNPYKVKYTDKKAFIEKVKKVLGADNE